MDIGILLWNTCNARCAHCIVSSSPDEKRNLTIPQVKGIIDGAFVDSNAPSIGFSGGEAFLFYDDLVDVVSYATRRGAKVAVNTNCFWAEDIKVAKKIAAEMKQIGVLKLVASTDDFHRKYIPIECVENAVLACECAELEIEIQYVASKSSRRLTDLLQERAIFAGVTSRELPCHPVGRASNMNSKSIPTHSGIPSGACPNSVLSVSADGRYIPCCNTAGHLPALEQGTVGEDQTSVYKRYTTSAVMNFLWSEGPIGLVATAKESGFTPSPIGYIDQCHLCHDLFRDGGVAEAVKLHAELWACSQILERYRLGKGANHSLGTTMRDSNCSRGSRVPPDQSEEEKRRT